MIDEPANAESKTTASPDGAEPDVYRAEVARLKAQADWVGAAINRGMADHRAVEEIMLFMAASIYSKAFLEALAKRHADGVADLVRERFRKKGTTTELQIGVDDGSATTVIVTGDLPDEARLALLDLDVTAYELRGKLLRWDRATSAWCPADDQ